MLAKKCNYFFIAIAVVLLIAFSPLTVFGGQLSGSNGTDVIIPDANGNGTWTGIYLSGAPSGAKVTSVEYRVRVVEVYVWDIELELESPAGSRKVIWYQGTGGATDGGYDDDIDDDNDIYLNWRVESSYFDNENPNGWWYLNAWDLAAPDEGYIDYFEIRVNYEVPFSDLQLVESGCYISASTKYPGSRFTVYYRVYNPNSSSVTFGLGASIRPTSGGTWIDDPAHDTNVSIGGGATSNYSRYFDIPTSACPGSYTVAWGIHNSSWTGMYDYFERNDLTVDIPSPSMYDITPNPSYDGNYRVSWTDISIADGYELIWSTDPSVPEGSSPGMSIGYNYLDVTGMPAGTWYYKVRAIKCYPGHSSWSNIKSVNVVSITPTRFRGDHFINKQVNIGAPVLLEAILERNTSGNPVIPNETVYFEIYYSGAWHNIGSDITDANGIASVYYTPPKSLSPNSYSIRAKYNGSGTYLPCELTRTLTITKPSWIFMYYMCHGNNLDNGIARKFEQIAGNLPNQEIEVFMLCDRLSIQDYVFRMKNDTSVNNYTNGVDRWTPSQIGISGNEFDSGNVNTLNAFTDFVNSKCTADHFALIIFNHGGGIHPTFDTEPADMRIEATGIGWDGNDYLSISELGQGGQNIKNKLGQKLDILHLDACLMQMIEINYEIANHVNYLVASENEGWANNGTGGGSWETYLSNVTSSTTTLNLAVNIATSYFNWSALQNGTTSVEYGRTISVTDLGHAGNVKTAIDNLSSLLVNNMGTIYSQIVTARNDAQKFAYFDTNNTMTQDNIFLDLRDFCEEIRDHCSVGEVVTAANNVISAIGNAGGNFIRFEDHENASLATVNDGYWFDRGTYGVSIFFPETTIDTYRNYINDSSTPANLLFTSATNWDEFLEAYFGENPPAAPTNLQATAVSPFQIDLVWEDNSYNETEFRIWRRIGTSGPFEWIGTMAADIEYFPDTGLLPNTTYQYAVHAHNDYGNSPDSNIAQATTPDCIVPPQPGGLSPCGGQMVPSPVTLIWNSVNGADSYKVRLFSGENCINFQQEIIVTAPSSSTGQITLPDGSYSWHVTAVNSCGETSSSCCNFQVGCPQPGAPTNPSPMNGATNISIDSNLNWDDCTNAVSYDVYWGISYPPPYHDSTGESFYDLPQLEYGTQYHWKIVAKNACGDTPGADWNFTTEEYAMPHISLLNPSEGPIGTPVIISGSDFGIDEGTVTFNGVNAVVDSWSETEIETTVPQGASTGPVVVHSASGYDSNGVTFTVTEQPTANKADFDRDGYSDVIWRYQGPEGYNAVWLSGNATGAASEAASVSIDEAIKAMNTDGKKPGMTLESSIWATLPEAQRHTVIDGFAGLENMPVNNSPSASFKLMSSAMATSVSDPRNDPQSADLITVADQNWKLCGTGDFNGDGNIDIVWSNVDTAHNCVWYMNGTTYVGYGQLPDGATTDWVLGGVGDFDRDGNPDLIWHNVVDGRNGIWYLEGVQLKGIDVMTTGANVNWKLSGTGDFNNDGHVDLVWRNITDGSNAVWYMDGVELSSVGWLDPVADLNWKLRGTGDFNNDGKIDLIWTYISDGRNAVWYLDGVTFTGAEFLTTVTDTTWMIRNQ